MNITKLYGIFAPVPSNCDDEDRFLEEEFAANIRRLFETGVHGLYVCGGTGDALLMRTEERKKAAEIAVGLAREYKKQIIVHVGGSSLRDAIELARHAESIGASAISSLPPMGYAHPQIVDYYRQLAGSMDLPVIIYNIPGMTHITPTTKELLELLAIPGVVGIKVSAWNVFQIRELRCANPDILIFNGYDEMVGLGLICGAQGAIGTWINLFPHTYVAMHSAASRGDMNTVVELHTRFTTFLAKTWAIYGPVECFEELMRQAGYAARCFRRPHADLPEELRAATAALLPEVAQLEAYAKSLQ